MLKLKYLYENYDLAKECLKNYDFEEESLERMLSYFRISSNAIYPFFRPEPERKVCFLRLAPVEEKSAAEVSSEIRLIEWLIQKGFLAMKPVRMKNGKASDRMDTEWGSYLVSCFEKVPGETLDDVENGMELVEAYGELLGKMHSLLEEYPYAEERRDHKALLDEVQGRLEKHMAPSAVMRELEKVRAELNALPTDRKHYGVVHYDFQPDNVLYDEEAKRFGVIDFDDAVQCWYTLDIVRVFDSLDDMVEEDRVEEAKTLFLKGYQKLRPLTAEELGEFSVMYRLVSLQEYATILHVLSDPPEEKPDWMEEIIDKLQYRLKKLTECMENRG